LYCGKEIGAFRLLRDSEFCSNVHRKKYGTRLDRALHEIAEPEPAPAGIASFRDDMRIQQGNTLSRFALWQTGSNHTWIGEPWPLTIDTSEADAEPSPAPAAAPAANAEYPPLSERWMTAPSPEPVAAFVQATSNLAPALRVRFAGLEPVAMPAREKYTPAVCANWKAAPAPEPVAAFVQASAVLTPVSTLCAPRIAAGLQPAPIARHAAYRPDAFQAAVPPPAPEQAATVVHDTAARSLGQTLRLPQFAGTFGLAASEDQAFDTALDTTTGTPNLCERWIPGFGPEPVEAWVNLAAALAPVLPIRLPVISTALINAPAFGLAPVTQSPAPEPAAAFVAWATALTPAPATLPMRMMAGMKPEHIQNVTLAVCSQWMPATESVVSGASNVPQPAALRVERPAAPPQLPAPQLAAFLEPLPSLDDLMDPPAMCESWMPAPGADPVFSYLQSSSAPAVTPLFAITLPAFDLSLADTHIPSVSRSKTVPTAEAVMAAILPSAAKGPVVPIRANAAVTMPGLVTIPGERVAVATAAACAPPPVAVESWLAASLVSVPLAIKHTALTGAELADLPVLHQPAPALCRAVEGLAPEALEYFVVPSMAAALAPDTKLHLPPFAMSATRDRAVPIYGARSLAPAVSQPPAGAVRMTGLQPIGTLTVTAPAEARPCLETAVPSPGLQPVDFHTHRPHTALVTRTEWIRPHPALEAPRFLLRPVLEKFEDPAAQQKAPRKESVVEIRNMPSGKRSPALWMAVGRIAAMFIMGVTLWFATANFLGERRMAREMSSGAALSVAANTNSGDNGAPVAHKATGPMARVRQAIADRAALRIAENFRDMENFDGADKTRPEGWNRHRDGYMNTGALALFRPTLKFSDYRMEFFGQIESKSMGWTVRSTDVNNYHAMKLTVVEAGMRPFVALVHYNVVDGKSRHRTQTPLNVMVHNNRPMQLAVDVHGSRIVTSINGEEVDSYIDNTLMAGGVGFFSEAGERARLYWMKVARNDDWLGHVCAMLTEGVGASSAGLHRRGIPGGVPMPGLPDDGDGLTLSAMWIALPYLGATRKTRFLKTWRSEPWNT
jgi:hypothetical protein